jgi:single-strand DNA-binding protein
LTMLEGRGGGEGRGGDSFDDRGMDDGPSFGGGAKKRVGGDGPKESFNQELDDEIPF